MTETEAQTITAEAAPSDTIAVEAPRSSPLSRVERIEERIDRVVGGEIAVDDQAGGLLFEKMSQLMEFAKMMAVSGHAVPKHLRGSPGACLAICTRAMRWQFDPFFVAEHSYIVEKYDAPGDSTIAYDSQIIHAVIEAHAPLTKRLRPRYTGEGDDRKCTVVAYVRGEAEPFEWTSPRLADRRPPKNEKGRRRGSPLWDSKPDVQLFYDTSRDLARIFFPEVIGGVYSKDEMEEHGFVDASADRVAGDDAPPDKVAGLKSRLAEKSKEPRKGFDHEHVVSQTREVAPTKLEAADDEAKTVAARTDPAVEATVDPVRVAGVDPEAGETGKAPLGAAVSEAAEGVAGSPVASETVLAVETSSAGEEVTPPAATTAVGAVGKAAVSDALTKLLRRYAKTLSAKESERTLEQASSAFLADHPALMDQSNVLLSAAVEAIWKANRRRVLQEIGAVDCDAIVARALALEAALG